MQHLITQKTAVKIKRTLIALLGAGLLLQGSLSYADDTDIFFGQSIGAIKPNIFFVLDDSGSMSGWLGGKTRLQTLKDTMDTLLDNLDDGSVNVGLMGLRKADSRRLYGPPLTSEPVSEINSASRIVLKNKVNAMTAHNYTPVVMSLYHAARYLTRIPTKHDAWAIAGNPSSPIVGACQATHLVLLTDGEANAPIDGGAIQALTGKSCNGHADCSNLLARWMYNADHYAGATTPGARITTHTISFANGYSKYLDDIARSSGAEAIYRTAGNADDLLQAFNDIIDLAVQVPNATMVNATIPKNTFSSNLEHKKDIYYPLFKPYRSARWDGNLKKYALNASGGKPVVKDATGADVYDSSGAFNSAARSFWSAAADGGEVTKGGAASRLPDANSRRLFVYNGALPPGSSPVDLTGYKLSTGNSAITAAMLNAADSNERKALLDYIRSKKIGDPLHSSPMLYSNCKSGSVNDGKCSGTEEQMVIMGTNEGFVHLFDADSGEEQFAFMPGELLKNIKKLKDNGNIASSDGHPYGMDNTVTLWVNDENKNGRIDVGDDHVYAYASMRRGGRGLYALDITRSKQPRLLWKIIGGETSGFNRLGYTFSQPIKSRIKDNGQEVDVLIFAAGYNLDEDAPTHYRQAVSHGNDVYIVNAKSGQLLWSASMLGLPDMKYSIPGKVKVTHFNPDTLQPDQYANQMVLADTGGQIWRFFINNTDTGEGAFSVTADNGNGLVAKTGGSGIANNRRFYHSPDAVIMRKDAKLAVNIGTGYHARPLNTDADDRFYSIRLPLVANGGLIDLDNNNQMLDVTHKLTASEGENIVSEIKADNKKGWYFKMNDSGEKTISSSTTKAGQVFFNVYVPGVQTDPCQAASGISYTYIVDMLNGQGVYTDAGGSSTPDRRVAHAMMSNALPGEPYLFVQDGNLWMQIGPGNFIKVPKKIDDGNKTYWMDLET